MDLSSVDLVLVASVVVLLVVALLQGQRLSRLTDRVERVERVEPQVAPGTSGLSPEVEQEVRRLLISNKKIMAIKLVRERTGLGLAEAKGLVDRF